MGGDADIDCVGAGMGVGVDAGATDGGVTGVVVITVGADSGERGIVLVAEDGAGRGDVGRDVWTGVMDGEMSI